MGGLPIGITKAEVETVRCRIVALLECDSEVTVSLWHVWGALAASPSPFAYPLPNPTIFVKRSGVSLFRLSGPGSYSRP